MPISIWAGVECTINRVGDLYLDQCRKSGHDQRLSDIALFASLGIERLRYPFLWETATRDGKSFEWNEFAERLREMERVGLVPIAGLLHHGSGPSFTSLIENNFIENFVDYATQFARRFPWVEDYTPINEPLTTARFSGLYGIWYPHKHSDAVFVRALFQQIKATVLAMRCVREVNPRARLIQTEDLGRAQGTEKLQYQVHFENERRWLSFDLLCGKVDSHHYLYKYLIDSGLTERELKWLLENSMPPDILGINHYLLSNRFLDQRLELYPECFHGGNGQDRYADVGAVDFPYSEAPLAEKVFLEAWQRYHLPMAVTEIHMHGFRESQMRWFKEIRAAAENLQQQGVDMRAITAWSLLGSFDWNSLCTNCLDYYESGVFDIRANKPRPTALVPMIKSYVDNKEFQHPLLEQEGWWRKSSPISAGKVPSSKPILITGATGTLGQTFRRICQQRHLSCQVLTRQEMDIADFEAVEEAINEIKPWAVINTAGYVRVDLAESEPEKCFRENVAGPENLARICADKKIPLVTFSSDFVFDGSGSSPYLEDHPVSPINVYGQSKAESEKIIFHNYSDALVVRTSSFFGPWDEHNFLTNVLRALIQGQPVDVANDMTMSPTYLPDLVNTCLDLLIDGVYGLLHLANSGQVSWAEFATMAATAANSKGLALLDYRLIRPCATSDLKLVAKRPSYSALSTEKARILPSLEDAIDRYFYDLKIPIFNHAAGGEL